jgi:hypothetical protein
MIIEGGQLHVGLTMGFGPALYERYNTMKAAQYLKVAS